MIIMKRIFFAIAMAMLLMTVSCEKNSDPADSTGGSSQLTFSASLENVAGKSAWVSGEKVAVFAKDGVSAAFEAKTSGASVDFSGELVESSDYYAVWPYAADMTLNSTVISAQIPAVQTAVEGACGSALLVAKAADKTFAFKNVTALFKITIPTETTEVTKIVLTSVNGEPLTGQVNINMGASVPLVAAGQTVSAAVTVEKIDKSAFDAGEYYVAVIAGAKQGGVTIEAFNAAGESLMSKLSPSDLQMKMGQVQDLGSILISVGGEFAITEAPAEGEIVSLSDVSWQLGTTSNGPVTWTSENDEIAVVDQSGKVSFLMHGEVTISATNEGGDTKSVKFVIPAGFYRDSAENPEILQLWKKHSTHTQSLVQEDDYIIATPKVNEKIQGRGDILRVTTYLNRKYPILCFRFEDVNDRTIREVNPSRQINIDTDTDPRTIRGNLGGSNNKWIKKYKCSDGSAIFYYDLNKQGCGGNEDAKMLPADGSTLKFKTFGLKYADINNNSALAELKPEEIAYKFYWFRTYTSVEEMEAYLQEWSKRSGITYSAE